MMNGFKTVIKKKKWNPQCLKLFEWENCVDRVGNTDLAKSLERLSSHPDSTSKKDINEFILNIFFGVQPGEKVASGLRLHENLAKGLDTAHIEACTHLNILLD
jgi:hypothetical protein